jgi:hypothetical protein
MLIKIFQILTNLILMKTINKILKFKNIKIIIIFNKIIIIDQIVLIFVNIVKEDLLKTIYLHLLN